MSRVGLDDSGAGEADYSRPGRSGEPPPSSPPCCAPVGCQNWATVLDQGFCPACPYSLMSPPRTGPAPDRPPGRAGDGVVGLRRPELAAATGVLSGVVNLVLSRIECRWRHRRSASGGWLRPGDEHEPFRRRRSRGIAAGSTALTPVLASPSQASDQVNVLVAGLGRTPSVPVRGFAAPPGERTDIWRTGPGAKPVSG